MLLDYTTELSFWLSQRLPYDPIVSYKEKLNKIKATRTFLNILLNKFKLKIDSDQELNFDNFNMNNDMYLHIVEESLFEILFLLQHKDSVSKRNEIKSFLEGKRNDVSIIISKFEGLGNMPDSLKSITLNQDDLKQYRDNKLVERFLWGIRSKTISAVDLKPSRLLEPLKEPISQLGSSLKNLADRYIKTNKKLHLIPMNMHEHGLSQIGTTKKSKYINSASDRVKIDGKTWNSWELDGSSEASLNQFSSKFKDLLWALLEGRCTIFIYAEDLVTSNFIPVGAFSLISGALSPEKVIFSDKLNHRGFSNFNQKDTEFYSEIENVILSFKFTPLFLIPKKVDSVSDWYNFPF